MVENGPPAEPPPEPILTAEIAYRPPLLMQEPAELPPGVPLQFSLQHIFLVMTVLGIALAVCVQMGLLGALLVWSCVSLTSLLTLGYRTPLTRALRVLTWGVLIPLVCLVFDPMIVAGDSGAFVGDGLTAKPDLLARWQNLNNGQFLIYAILLWQMVALAWWVLLPPCGGIATACLVGTLLVGAIAAIGFSLVVGFFSIMVLLMACFPIAVMGLTPIATAWAYGVSLDAAYRAAKRQLRPEQLWTWGSVGFAMALGVPYFAMILFSMIRGT